MSKSNQLIQQPFVRIILLACAVLFLAVLAWWTLNDGIQQIPRAQTIGQQVETFVQILGGMLSVFVVITSFRLRKWAKPVRVAWIISIILIGGLSSLVWGPPMPVISLVFAGLALLLSLGTVWALRTALNEEPFFFQRTFNREKQP